MPSSATTGPPSSSESVASLVPQPFALRPHHELVCDVPKALDSPPRLSQNSLLFIVPPSSPSPLPEPIKAAAKLPDKSSHTRDSAPIDPGPNVLFEDAAAAFPHKPSMQSFELVKTVGTGQLITSNRNCHINSHTSHTLATTLPYSWT